MLEISRHIESLLLEHDCVIIPDLGGFVTHHVSARFLEGESLFLPPCRSVGFNAQLQMNDGVLVQSVMLAEDASYPEAVRLVAEMVAEVKQALQDRGRYTFANVGTLTFSLDGRYHFAPNESGVITPELYALDGFSLQRLDAQPTAEEDAPTTTLHPTRKSRDYVFRIQREWVNYGVAAVAAVALFFAWSVPSADKITTTTERAAIFTQELFRPAKKVPTMSVAPAAEMAEAKLGTATPAAEKAATAAPKTVPTEPVAPPRASKTYTLVLASAVTQRNAEAFAEQLQKEGHTQASVWTRHKMVRVVYGTYATEAEAQAQLNALRRNPAFASAWVMERKQ